MLRGARRDRRRSGTNRSGRRRLLGQAERLRADAGRRGPGVPARRRRPGPRDRDRRARPRTPSPPRSSGAGSAARRRRLLSPLIGGRFSASAALRSAPSWMVLVSPHAAGPAPQEDPVSAFLFRLGRSSARHPFRVLGLWLVAAVAVMALQGSAGGQFDNSERVPGVESQHAADVLNDRFPSQGGQSARIVLHTDDGRLDDADHAADRRRRPAPQLAGRAPTSPASPTRSRPQSAAAQRRRADRLPRRHLRARQAHRPPSSTTRTAVTDAARAGGVRGRAHRRARPAGAGGLRAAS